MHRLSIALVALVALAVASCCQSQRAAVAPPKDTERVREIPVNALYGKAVWVDMPGYPNDHPVYSVNGKKEFETEADLLSYLEGLDLRAGIGLYVPRIDDERIGVFRSFAEKRDVDLFVIPLVSFVQPGRTEYARWLVRSTDSPYARYLREE